MTLFWRLLVFIGPTGNTWLDINDGFMLLVIEDTRHLEFLQNSFSLDFVGVASGLFDFWAISNKFYRLFWKWAD